ncbi:hypothetical protein WISP_75736 [Willisornis vidua]|uniref:Uncharacterized protein n=1 Tax=Willisornis vidua TaxID=1566151 RepID=A0ABQ9DB02_9PASS|nr:hypothetical protein WISP_75736 [Willisornis vidua]
MVQTIARQAVALQTIGVYGDAQIHLMSMENPTLQQVDAPEGDYGTEENLHWSRVLAGPGERTDERRDRAAWWTPGVHLESTLIFKSPLMDPGSIALSTGLGVVFGPYPKGEQWIPDGSNRAALWTWLSTEKKSSPKKLSKSHFAASISDLRTTRHNTRTLSERNHSHEGYWSP